MFLKYLSIITKLFKEIMNYSDFPSFKNFSSSRFLIGFAFGG